MYAIIQTGGKQLKVQEGDVIKVEKLEGEAGDKVTFDILFINDGKKIITDADKLAKASVEGKIVRQFRGDKQLVFKFKRRKNYKRLKGHRQHFTEVEITKVKATSRATKKKEEAKPKAEDTADVAAE